MSDDTKEEEQVDTTQHVRPRHKYVISGGELNKTRLKLNELGNYFSSHSSQEIPPQIDELIILFQNISDRSKLRKPFNYINEITPNHAENMTEKQKKEDNVVAGDLTRSHRLKLRNPFNYIDESTAKPLNNHAQNMVNETKKEEQKEDNVVLDDLTYDLMEINNLYSPITLLEFNIKHQTITCDVADILSKEPDYKTQCNCLILSNDSQQQINDAIKQIQNTLNLTDKQMIGVKRRIHKYYEWRKLYNAGCIKEFTNEVAIFTMIDCAISTTDAYAKPNDLNTWRSVHYLLRFIKEYIDNGGNLEMYLFELGRLNIPEKRISEIVCKKYKLGATYFKVIKAVMKTWIRNNMSFVSQQINKSFTKVYISKEMIANGSNSEQVVKHLWVKSRKLSSYKTYKTNAGFENLKLILFWTNIFNDENERMYAVAGKYNTFEKPIVIIINELISCDKDKMEIVKYGIKMHELPVFNTNGNTLEVSNVNKQYFSKMNLYIEPSTENSSLKITAKEFKTTQNQIEKKLPLIGEEKAYEYSKEKQKEHNNNNRSAFVQLSANQVEESKEDSTVADGKNNDVDKNNASNDADGQLLNMKDSNMKDSNIKGAYEFKMEKANEDLKVDEKEIEFVMDISGNPWSMKMEHKWTQSIMDKKAICESFPAKETFFYYLKYTMLLQQINGDYKAFNYDNKQYIIFNTELTCNKSKDSAYIIGVKENGKWRKEAFMNASEINKTYGITKDNLPIGTRVNSEMFQITNSFNYSLICNISTVMYAKLPPIFKKKQKIKNKIKIKLTKLCELIENAIYNKSEILPIVTIDKKKKKIYIDAALPIQLDDNNWCFIIYRDNQPIAIGIDCGDIKIKSKLYNAKCNVYNRYEKIQNNITSLQIINDQNKKKMNRKRSYQGIIETFNVQNGRILCNELQQSLFFLKSAFEPSDYNKLRKNVVVEFEVEMGSVVPRVAKARIIGTESHRRYKYQKGYGCYKNNMMYTGNGCNNY